MAKSQQSELHPDDGIDLTAIILTCGACGEVLERGTWRTAGFEGQRYTVYPYTCSRPTLDCSAIGLSVPRIDGASTQRVLSEVNVTSLEVKSDRYLEPVRRERRGRRTIFEFARGHGERVEVIVDVPTVG